MFAANGLEAVTSAMARAKNVTRIPEIIARLDAAYGIPTWRPHHDPTSELVLTILSQNTISLKAR